MKVWVVMAREGFAREVHGAYMSEAQALAIVRAMNTTVKKDKYETIGVEVR